MIQERSIVIGGGVTGLAAGMASGATVYEAAEQPGGICSSYYVRPNDEVRLPSPPDDGEAYRFELGGGHWIFGGVSAVRHFLQTRTRTRQYSRLSGIWFAQEHRHVPYPLQHHLRCLDPSIVGATLQEMLHGQGDAHRTMEDWLYSTFGQTLCGLFFVPFHELYTAGLFREISPQDTDKSPIDLPRVIRGAFGDAQPAGYNMDYLYPENGLDCLARQMASACDIRHGKKLVRINVAAHQAHFSDGDIVPYRFMICTLPLNRTMELAGLRVDDTPDPHTSVLVLNIGGERGTDCPGDHWLYHPQSQSGFHRVGFYSNVDSSFLPAASRKRQDKVSIYVERAYRSGAMPDRSKIERYQESVVCELQQWGFLGQPEVVDPTWIDVAYTWKRPDSEWRAQALGLLEKHDIYMVGRFARWKFQGIADSIRDGFVAGASFCRAE